MSADPVPEDEIKDLARNAPLTRPRPGHADLVGMQKYNFDDARPILERASARETAARVALGAVMPIPTRPEESIVKLPEGADELTDKPERFLLRRL